jgi:two-component system, sensor histidine kinase SagS
MATSYYAPKRMYLKRRKSNFQQRLKTLHEVSMALAKAETFDELCYLAIMLGREKLGFDRLGLWFRAEDNLFRGTFGTDEDGNIRDERHHLVPMKFATLVERLDGRVFVSPNQSAPIQSDQSKIVGYGMNAIAMVWDGDHNVGWLSTDNLLTGRIITNQDLELLALYATSLGHLASRFKAQEQALELAAERERVRFLMDFITGFSHDFRTPLTVINTSLYLMEHAPTPEMRQDKQAKIHQQIQLMERYVEDILTTARLEQLTSIDGEHLQINHLLETLIPRFQQTAAKRNIAFYIELKETPFVIANGIELTRALVNLLDNAFVYTPDGGTVSLRTMHDGDQVVIEIEDTGYGINAAELNRIFEYFYRADRARPVTTGGTGLGLSIAQRIIQLHGGRIEVYSEPQKGSIFRVILPALI